MVKSITMRLLSVLILILFSCAGPRIVADDRPSAWSQKIELDGFSNIYKIDDQVYRSEQPHSREMNILSEYGIKSILNLRQVRNDNREAKGTTLVLKHVPINTWRMSYDDLVKAMVFMQSAEKPVLVHCLHGSDRTGAVIAAYRIVHNGWTKEEAIKELVEGGYGYHATWFPNIIELINSLNVEDLKKDIQINTGR
jgi:protein tyrosine/serine phosphatase